MRVSRRANDGFHEGFVDFEWASLKEVCTIDPKAEYGSHFKLSSEQFRALQTRLNRRLERWQTEGVELDDTRLIQICKILGLSLRDPDRKWWVCAEVNGKKKMYGRSYTREQDAVELMHRLMRQSPGLRLEVESRI